MGNQDVRHTPEDKKAKADREELFEVVESLRLYLEEMNSSLFSVGELRKLIIPYIVGDIEQYKQWLLALKSRVDSGCAGGRHSATRTKS